MTFEEVLKAQGLEEGKIKAAVAALEGLRKEMTNALVKAQSDLEAKVKLADELEEKLASEKARADELEKELEKAGVAHGGGNRSHFECYSAYVVTAMAILGVLLGILGGSVIGRFWFTSELGNQIARADKAEEQVVKLGEQLEAKKAELTRALAGKMLEVPALPALDVVPTFTKWGKQFVDGSHPQGVVNIVCGPAAPDVFYSEYPTDTPERYWQLSCGKESRLRQ